MNTFSAFWQNVIHLTRGGDCCGSGQRIPAIFISDSRKFHICHSINGTGNNCYDQEPVPEGRTKTLVDGEIEPNTWISIEISQTKNLTNGKFIYRIKIDGEIAWETENTLVQVFKDVQVYAGASTSVYQLLDGKIRNFLVETKGCLDSIQNTRI